MTQATPAAMTIQPTRSILPMTHALLWRFCKCALILSIAATSCSMCSSNASARFFTCNSSKAILVSKLWSATGATLRSCASCEFTMHLNFNVKQLLYNAVAVLNLQIAYRTNESKPGRICRRYGEGNHVVRVVDNDVAQRVRHLVQQYTAYTIPQIEPYFSTRHRDGGVINEVSSRGVSREPAGVDRIDCDCVGINKSHLLEVCGLEAVGCGVQFRHTTHVRDGGRPA